MDDIRDDDGNVWKLGWKAPDERRLQLRAATVNIQDWREQAGQSRLLDRSEWLEKDFVTDYPKELIEDQGQYGSCSAATVTGADNRMRSMRGQPYTPLSWAWLYDQVNGGHDNGSNIGDASEVARTQGIPPFSSYQKPKFKAGKDPTGVLYYKEDVEVTLASFDEIATFIIAHNGLAQFPVDASTMRKFDGNGIGQGKARNPNHSIYGAGIRFINGAWYILGVTSWRSTWGPFKNGSWLISEAQIHALAEANDGNGHISTLDPTLKSGEAA